MEIETDQIGKRLEWLDEERRRDRATIAALEQRLATLDANDNLLRQQLKELEGELHRLSTVSARMDQYDGLLAQHRSEVARQIETSDKRHDKAQREAETRRRAELDAVNQSVADLGRSLDGLAEVRKTLQAHADADTRLTRSITDAEHKIEEVIRADEEIRRTARVLEENRKQDLKRVTDLQGEVAAVRKRAEEQREKHDANSDAIKHLDTRINELLSTEAERKQTQRAFIEQQAMAQVERDRAWKDIQARFETFSKQTATLDTQLNTLDSTHQAVKKSQETFADLNQRLERRINEITEMQRLAEERMRQEWITFKADDQKRWTNYNLAHEELLRDLRQDMDKLTGRLTELDDALQNQEDLLQQTTETTENQLQDLMNWAHEWLTGYERIMGRPKK
jgi:chromosome segregation ATPase